MSRESDFLIYCMERYRYHKKLSGKETAELFKKAALPNIYSRISVHFILSVKST